MKGLGAAIIQDGYPVTFVPKSLDSTQSNYPNIDREMLAVVFGITLFHTYLYGRPFKVITDHKPLEMTVQNPLLKARLVSNACYKRFRDTSTRWSTAAGNL